MKLKIRRRRTHRESEQISGTLLGQAHQRTRARQRSRIRQMYGQCTGLARPMKEPVRRYASTDLAARPTPGIHRFKVDRRSVAQFAADDQRIVASAQAANCPHPRQVARLEKEDKCYGREGCLRLADSELDCGRTKPPDGGALAEQGQAALHPVHQRASPADISDRSDGKPGDQGDRKDADHGVHRTVDDNTRFAAGWKRAIREFAYGLSAYEIAQQALELRATMETLFILGVFGDMLGVPILPPYYGLRILPFVVPQIETWKQRLVRERELGTDHEHHLHGL